MSIFFISLLWKQIHKGIQWLNQFGHLHSKGVQTVPMSLDFQIIVFPYHPTVFFLSKNWGKINKP